MKRFFRENASLKALALLVAFLLWVTVGTGQMLERRESVRLEFAGIPPGFLLGPGAKGQVSVVLRGRREALRDLDPEILKAVVTFRADQKAEVETILTPRVRELPKGVVAEVPSLTLKLVKAPSNGR